jgi:hypothetical protein
VVHSTVKQLHFVNTVMYIKVGAVAKHHALRAYRSARPGRFGFACAAVTLLTETFWFSGSVTAASNGFTGE